MSRPIKKILIANRGEIALRIIRACKEMDIATVAVHSTADRDSMHVRLADESVCIGPAPSKQSYLNMGAIISAALVTNVDAIHPGVGFLSENPDFAHVVEEHGLIFIGPTRDHIAAMGDKIIAKQTMAALGLPTIPGSDGIVEHLEDAIQLGKDMGFPVLIKAVSGGGGKGMQVAFNTDELASAIHLAQAEAKANFGNSAIYMERYLSQPRHIEVQVMGDMHGNVVCLGERDCSIQRRHQKIWEEARSPGLTDKEREKLMALVAKGLKKYHYRGAGTLEFLYEDGHFYFMEMNTRIQVEHPITEEITGIDLIKAQIRVAEGHPLGFTQDDIQFSGHAIECRINAENAITFMPSPGTIQHYHPPGGPGVRIDSHLYAGYRMPAHYDSLVAKLIVHAPTREECLWRVNRALKEYVITGIDTLLPLHSRLVHAPDIISGNYHIHWLEDWLKQQADSGSA